MLRSPFLKLSMLFFIVYLSSCTLLGDRFFQQEDLSKQVDNTLAELPKARDHLKELRTQTIDKLSEATEESLLLEVSTAYKEAFSLADKPLVRQEIQQRLAYIHLQLAEERQVNDASLPPKAVYKEAIDSYLALLAHYDQQDGLAVIQADEALFDKAVFDEALFDKALFDEDQLDQILYPLAKAYEMSGDIPKALAVFNRLVIEAPNSVYYSEAQFRRAEILFAAADYAAASHAYRSVIDRSTLLLNTSKQSAKKTDNSATFLMNSWYMFGWSDFKLGRYRSAIKAFFTVLDNQPQLDTDNELLAKHALSSQQALTNDTLRVMSLAFSYEAGSETIADMLDEFYVGLSEPEYVPKLYQNLAGLYLEKKRFIDSADTLAAYIYRYSKASNAPDFHKQLIKVYAAGVFPDRVREQKQQYVQAYGVHSEFWSMASTESRLAIQDSLSLYIKELASYYHHLAQTKQRQRKASLYRIERNRIEQNPIERQAVIDESVQLMSEQDIQLLYQQAGDWYETWIANIPSSAEIDNIWFLLGETRFESKSYQLAIKAYENAAYGSFGRQDSSGIDSSPNPTVTEPVFNQHNEAAYAALLAYDHLIAGHNSHSSINDDVNASKQQIEQQTEQWQIAKNQSALLFANTFPNDNRSNAVLAQTLQSLFSLKQFNETIKVGQQLVDRLAIDNTDASSTSVEDSQKFKVIAYLSIAHAQSELHEYDLSEQAYAEVLSVLNKDVGSSLYQQHYAASLENYAASIYQQGLLQTEAGEHALAANNFMRVVELAPSSSIRLSAQRDAIALFLQIKKWRKAVSVMTDFQQRFVTDTATKAMPSQLLLAYKSLEDWPLAAAQAKKISVDDDDPNVRQQALYSAAEFYYLAEDIDNAIDSYRSYAHSYTLPLADNMEAQYRLTELYAETLALDKRAYWLRKLMVTHKNAESPTERSRYLAAFSAVELAETTLLSYQSIPLAHPLKQSMANKRKAMKVSLDAYHKALSYDLELFSTQATYRIAEIYAGLASALLASERPAGLTALELEQYNFLLEEQAYPFEEKAIDFYTINIERSWQGIDSEWVRDSYQALAQLIPAKYGKREMLPERM